MSRVTLLALYLMLPASLTTTASAAQSQTPRETLEHHKTVITKWLDEAGLSDKLEVLRVRMADHPDGSASSRRGYRLELRFRTEASPQAARNAFQTFVNEQTASMGQSFPAACFYRFAHVLDISRDLASVHFYVLDTEYATFFDSIAREVVMRENPTRSVRRAIPLPVPTADRQTGASIPRTASDELSASIQRFLQSYFRAASASAQPAPNLDWRTFERDYVSVTVGGLRGVILSDHNYWEKLKISFEIRSAPTEWTVVSYVDGEYAAGLGRNQPADDSYYLMEKDFRRQLETYTDRMLSDLHRSLTTAR